jgi:hypothetical protein
MQKRRDVVDFDFEAPIESLELSEWTTRQLRDIGATTVGLVYIMTPADLINHVDADTYAKIVLALKEKGIKLKAEGGDFKKKTENVFDSIGNIPVGYLQVMGVVTDAQCLALESQQLLTWAKLAQYGKAKLAQLTSNDQPVFTSDDIGRIAYLFERRKLTFK